MSSTLPSNSTCGEAATLGVVLPFGASWACPDMMPSMKRAAPAAAPGTIFGNLNMAFFLASDGRERPGLYSVLLICQYSRRKFAARPGAYKDDGCHLTLLAWVTKPIRAKSTWRRPATELY